MNTNFDLDLMRLVRCPVSGAKLTIASAELLAKLNQKIERREVVNRAGETVDTRLESALTNTSQSWLYPIRSGIIVLIDDQAIPLT